MTRRGAVISNRSLVKSRSNNHRNLLSGNIVLLASILRRGNELGCRKWQMPFSLPSDFDAYACGISQSLCYCYHQTLLLTNAKESHLKQQTGAPSE